MIIYTFSDNKDYKDKPFLGVFYIFSFWYLELFKHELCAIPKEGEKGDVSPTPQKPQRSWWVTTLSVVFFPITLIYLASFLLLSRVAKNKAQKLIEERSKPTDLIPPTIPSTAEALLENLKSALPPRETAPLSSLLKDTVEIGILNEDVDKTSVKPIDSRVFEKHTELSIPSDNGNVALDSLELPLEPPLEPKPLASSDKPVIEHVKKVGDSSEPYKEKTKEESSFLELQPTPKPSEKKASLSPTIQTPISQEPSVLGEQNTIIQSPRIEVFSEEDQKGILEEHNKNKKKEEVIPLVLRNFNTGWPLLQVSFYTPITTESGNLFYGTALSGGKCHTFSIAAFSLAKLVTKIPGGTDIQIKSNKSSENEFTVEKNISSLLGGYEMSHPKIGVRISAIRGMYGEEVRITMDSIRKTEDMDDFHLTLSSAFDLAVDESKGGFREIVYFDDWTSDSKYRPEEIEKIVDTQVAIFFNGQIFIDLGYLLSLTVKRSFTSEGFKQLYEVKPDKENEIKEYFKHVFKVDQFLELTSKSPQFKPISSSSENFRLDDTLEIKEILKKISEEIYKAYDEIHQRNKEEINQRYDLIRNWTKEGQQELIEKQKKVKESEQKSRSLEVSKLYYNQRIRYLTSIECQPQEIKTRPHP